MNLRRTFCFYLGYLGEYVVVAKMRIYVDVMGGGNVNYCCVDGGDELGLKLWNHRHDDGDGGDYRDHRDDGRDNR